MSYNYNQNKPGGFQQQGNFQQQGGFQQPGQYPQMPPPKKGPSVWLILGIVGGIGFVCVALCCGVGFFFVNMGMDAVSADIEMQVRDDPVIVENIGEIESLDVDWVKSSAHEDQDTFIYDIKGSKGEGELTVKSVSDINGNEEIIWAALRTPDGQTHSLSPALPAEFEWLGD